KCIDAVKDAFAGDPATLARIAGNNGFLVIINEVIDSGADGAGRVLLDPGAWNPTFIAHEMGHVLGLDHSFDTSPVSWDVTSDGRPGAYGESLDIMSAQAFGGLPSSFQGPLGNTGPGLNAANREKLGWLPEAKILTLNQRVGGTVASLVTLGA